MRVRPTDPSLRGPLALAVLSAAPLLLWAASEPLGDRFHGSYSSLTSLAVLAALAGTSAFALNLVLGARLRVVEALFGGLDRMYRAHRLTGQAAFALLLAHVVLVLAGRATISTDSALALLGPGAGWTVFAGVLAFAGMTVAIVLTLFVRLGHEVFVYVQRSFGLVFLLASYHVFTDPGSTTGSTALRLYLALLATAGLAAFAYRSLLGNVLVRRRPYRVTAVNRLDEHVTEIAMEPRDRPLEHVPGQFLFVNFRSLALRDELRPFELSIERQVFSIRAGEIRNQFHPFSITSAPGARELRITVKAVGDYTRALRRLEPGAEAVVEGPYGSFSHLHVANRRQVWIAGGIGVTPFLSIARSLAEEDLDVDFYYCVEHAEEAHFLEELREIATRRPGFRVVLVPRDREGFLTAARLAAEIPDLASADVLVCGPPAMIASLRAQLAGVGVVGERFHAEEFSFAKLGRQSAAAVAGPAGEPRWSDGRVLALVSGLASAGVVIGLGIVLATYLAS